MHRSIAMFFSFFLFALFVSCGHTAGGEEEVALPPHSKDAAVSAKEALPADTVKKTVTTESTAEAANHTTTSVEPTPHRTERKTKPTTLQKEKNDQTQDPPTMETNAPAPEQAPSAATAEQEAEAMPPAPPQKELPADEKKAAPFTHQLWDDLLRTYVSSSGWVNYAGMRPEKARLEKYLALLQANPPQSSWSREEEMAFWINAYNAHTVKLILDHYPLKSIRDIDKGNPWDVKRIKIGNKLYSLNEIENEMLRKRFGDARIHFAVNCAAKSCPPLYNRAWQASTLSQTLDERAGAFINDKQYNLITPSKASVSKIFEWYASDFGDLIAFLNRYARVKLKAGAKVVFLEYDWSLNGK